MSDDNNNVAALMPADKNAQSIQVLRVETSINVSFTATPDDNNALTTGTQVVMISTTEAVWVKFGASGVTVTAAVAGAILIPGGGVSLRVAQTDTHFAVVRAGTTNGIISIAKLV
jgi:hypothetical protein